MVLGQHGAFAVTRVSEIVVLKIILAHPGHIQSGSLIVRRNDGVQVANLILSGPQRWTLNVCLSYIDTIIIAGLQLK